MHEFVHRFWSGTFFLAKWQIFGYSKCIVSFGSGVYVYPDYAFFHPFHPWIHWLDYGQSVCSHLTTHLHRHQPTVLHLHYYGCLSTPSAWVRLSPPQPKYFEQDLPHCCFPKIFKNSLFLEYSSLFVVHIIPLFNNKLQGIKINLQKQQQQCQSQSQSQFQTQRGRWMQELNPCPIYVWVSASVFCWCCCFCSYYADAVPFCCCCCCCSA